MGDPGRPTFLGEVLGVLPPPKSLDNHLNGTLALLDPRVGRDGGHGLTTGPPKLEDASPDHLLLNLLAYFVRIELRRHGGTEKGRRDVHMGSLSGI